MSNLLPIIKEIIFGRDVFQYEKDDRITMEKVESVRSDGKAQVRGVIVPITGVATVTVGEEVAVAWKKGTPVAIIKHRIKRAQFHSIHRKGGGIIEQLFIGNLDKLGNDVWYRNGTKVVKVMTYTVGVSPHQSVGGGKVVSVRNNPNLQGAVPQAVQWGLDGKSFAVQCTNGVYALFWFVRPDPNKYVEGFPGVASFFWMDRPLEDTTALTTVGFMNRVRKTFKYWIGKCFIASVYQAVQSAWFDGSMWYWRENWGGLEQGWETTMSGEGAAAVSSSTAFPLKSILNGTVRDWYNNANCRGTVLEWFLDGDGHLKILISVDWDYFWVGTSATGAGSLTYPVGYGPYGMDSYTEPITVGGTALGCIGAKRQSDHQTVPESHLFLWDATDKVVAWSTASQNPTLGNEQIRFTYGILEHNKRTDPGYSSSGLPDPHMPGWDKEPSSTESYYRGANWSNLPVTLYRQTEANAGEERTTYISNTGTYQLFDPSTLQCLQGPYVSVAAEGYSWAVSLLGGYTAYYYVAFDVKTGATQKLWHYRVQYGKVFTRRKFVAGGGWIETVYGETGFETRERSVDSDTDEALLFVVVERYPYIPGTGYINDLPSIWIGILDLTGAVVHVLRDWQYGLAGAELLTANGHEVVWSLLTGALDPKPTYYVTNLDSLREVAFSNEAAHQIVSGEVLDALNKNDITFLKQTNAKLFTPNFLWSDKVPERFYGPNALPETTEDSALTPFAHLIGQGGGSGSTRVLNDETLLMPLGKWQSS